MKLYPPPLLWYICHDWGEGAIGSLSTKLGAIMEKTRIFISKQKLELERTMNGLGKPFRQKIG